MLQTLTAVATQLQPPSDIELSSVTWRPPPTWESETASTHALRTSRDLPSDAPDRLGDITNLPSNTENVIPELSRWRTVVIISIVSCVMLISSMLTGILVVSLPTMAQELGLEKSLELWPASVTPLASGCTLLLFGSISDLVGGRSIYLTGCFFLAASTIACGVCKSGIQLILFRALSGVALSLCLPSSVQLITSNMRTGTRRNVAFASLGAAQPAGFAIGLVLGGVFVEYLGWRYGYYIGTVLILVVFVASFLGLPKDVANYAPLTWSRLYSEVDWIGCSLLSTSLGFLSYIFSILTDSTASFISPVPIALLSCAILLLPAFVFHVKRQERLSRPAIIPFSLFSNLHFMSLCLVVFLVWGVFNASQFFFTLYFQDILKLSPIQTSIRFLPMVVVGAGTNIMSGNLVSKVAANHLVLISAMITAISPLIMATIDIKSNYWLGAFWVVALAPVCADILFTVSNLVITQAFPPKMHGVAGGVFNTVSCFGNSVGLAVTAVVASSVTMAASRQGEGGEDKIGHLMQGYRVVYWACFGMSILTLGVVIGGMRKIGKVGEKMD